MMEFLRVLERDAAAREAEGWRFSVGWYWSAAVGRWAWFER